MKHHDTKHLTHLAKQHLETTRRTYNIPHDDEAMQQLEDIIHEINERDKRKLKVEHGRD